MTTAQAIIDKVEILLQDTSNDRWSEPDLLVWLNDAQREVVKEKPDANPVIESIQLVAGSLQTLPTGAVQLLDVNCNMGLDGVTAGDTITVVDRKFMDVFLPSWRAEAADREVTHVIYDPKRVPKKFWVYPQSPGTNYIEIITGKMPVDAELADELTLGQEYDTALIHYVLFMAHSIDAEYSGSAELAQAYYAAFLNALGIRESVEDRINPKRTREVQ